MHEIILQDVKSTVFSVSIEPTLRRDGGTEAEAHLMKSRQTVDRTVF